MTKRKSVRPPSDRPVLNPTTSHFRRLSATHQAQAPQGIETVRVSRSALMAREGIKGGSAKDTVAVIDCGTSSVRAFLAEVEGEHQRILEDLVFPVELTAGFTGGKLDREAMDSVVEAFAGIMTAASAYRITNIRAVATSALREANNSDVLIERIRDRFGIDLQVIDGPETARLYYGALRSLCARADHTLTGNTLLIDIGAGSTCIGLIRAGKLVHSVDEHYGTVRLYDQFKELSDSVDFSVTIDRFATGAARMMLVRLPSQTVSNLVVTGGEVRKLVSLLHAETGGLMESIDPKKLEAWWHEVSPLTPISRSERCGLDLFAAARLLPAAALLRHLCKETGAKRVLVPQCTLRDGLLADYLPGAGAHQLDASHLIAEAKQLVVRYGGELEYAENTASLATQLFDQTKALHGLSDRERTLLEFSALVHDVGSYINVRNRHKHTMYIIQSVDLPGLTQAEQDMVANVARYHRKSPPEPHHAEFTDLPRRDRVVVAYLAAFLRLAYALDVERSQRVKRIRTSVDGRRLLLRVDRRQIALERWSVAGKAGLFEEVFGLEVVVVPREDT
jgi:exopolyphosphatase/guanosine-5'-triphosphate,3'-diphosphate pyrophosphatase